MAKTIYQRENGDFSNACHELARQVFYPKLFSVEPSQIIYGESTLLQESERGKILDGELGIDRLIQCRVDGVMGHTIFAIQERFRRASYRNKYRDITLTEWNHATGQPSELSKINAGIFVYGYANEDVTDFLEVFAVNTASLILAVTSGRINYRRDKNKKEQSFLAFTIQELCRKNTIMFQYPTLWRPKDTVAKHRGIGLPSQVPQVSHIDRIEAF